MGLGENVWSLGVVQNSQLKTSQFHYTVQVELTPRCLLGLQSGALHREKLLRVSRNPHFTLQIHQEVVQWPQN